MHSIIRTFAFRHLTDKKSQNKTKYKLLHKRKYNLLHKTKRKTVKNKKQHTYWVTFIEMQELDARSLNRGHQVSES